MIERKYAVMYTDENFNLGTDSVFTDFSKNRVMLKLTDFFSLNNPTTAIYNESPDKSKAVYRVENGAAVTGSPAIHNGYIYYGTSSGVVCYEIDEKKESWNYTSCGVVCSGITVAGERLWFGNAGGKLCSLDLSDQNFQETSVIDGTTSTGLSSTPLVVGSTVYVTTQTLAYLKGYSTSDCSETVNISLGSRVAAYSSPSANSNTIYTSGSGGIVSCTGGNTVTNILTTDGRYWNAGVSQRLGVRCNKHDAVRRGCWGFEGTQWSVSRDGSAAAPVATDELVFLNDKTGLVAYGATTGEIVWTHNAAESAKAMLSVPYAIDKGLAGTEFHDVAPISPVLAGDIVFYAANFGSSAETGHSILFGINVKDGREYVPAAVVETGRNNYYYHFSEAYAKDQGLKQHSGTAYLNYLGEHT